MSSDLNRRSFLAGLGGIGARAFLPATVITTAALTGVEAQAQAASSSQIPLRLFNPHTNEKYDVELFVGSDWNANGLLVCDWMMRDWRQNKLVSCDRRLYAALYVLQRKFNLNEPIRVNSGFRSLETNRLLQRRGYNAADNSLHLAAKAVDFTLPGVNNREVAREVHALGLGGTGLYMRQGFVHMDSRGRQTRWGDSF